MVFILQWGETGRESIIITKYDKYYDKLPMTPSDKTVVQSWVECHLLEEITSKCKGWEQNLKYVQPFRQYFINVNAHLIHVGAC